jgi:2,3-bisphosphoglycerate-independent phosphoglycerate mutase
MKYLILVGDGMGDLPIAEIGSRTPLEAAKTPAMDELCRRGEVFMNRTVPEGFAPGSDVANLSLLGYNPAKYYTGRAPLEAAAMGIELQGDETAFRCNTVTLDFTADNRVRMIDFSAGHISNAESHLLIAALESGCASETFHFKAGVSYRHILVVKGPYPDLGTAPPHDYTERDVSHLWQKYLEDPAWAALLTKARRILETHPVNLERKKEGQNPANCIWLWGEGRPPAMPTLQQRFSISGSMISAVDLLKGLGVYSGLSVIDVPGATGYLDTNYRGKALAALDALQTQDFVFVHVEAPDEAGHQGLVDKKIQAIEDFDARIVAPIVAGLRERKKVFRVAVTMDHFTPIALRTHSTDPVPVFIYDSREKSPGSGLPFSEKIGSSKHKTICFNESSQLIEQLLEKKDRTGDEQ